MGGRGGLAPLGPRPGTPLGRGGELWPLYRAFPPTTVHGWTNLYYFYNCEAPGGPSLRRNVREWGGLCARLLSAPSPLARLVPEVPCWTEP